jgi:hypothetical protein
MFTMSPNINMVIFVDYQKQAIYEYCKYVQIQYSVFFAPQGSRSGVKEDRSYVLEFSSLGLVERPWL